VIETSDEAGRLVYTHGAQEIPPALEAALEGAVEGENREVHLAPADAFGERDLESIFSVPTDLVGDGNVPRSGDWIDMVVEPGDEDDFTEPYEFEAQVMSVDDDAIILDTNHPLAGQDVTFQVTVAVLSAPE
jgi:FKBP-type peptidyl-prolyl cis-trans isomerase 2